MYVLYVYVYLFLKNAKLQPFACETVPSLSVSLSLSHAIHSYGSHDAWGWGGVTGSGDV